MPIEMLVDPEDKASIWMTFGTSEFGLYHEGRFLAYAYGAELQVSHITFHGSGVVIKRFKEFIRQRLCVNRIKEIEVNQDDVTDHLAEKFFHHLVGARGPVIKIEEAVRINDTAIANDEQPIFLDNERSFYKTTRDFFQAFTHSVSATEIGNQRRNADNMLRKANKIRSERATQPKEKTEE